MKLVIPKTEPIWRIPEEMDLELIVIVHFAVSLFTYLSAVPLTVMLSLLLAKLDAPLLTVSPTTIIDNPNTRAGAVSELFLKKLLKWWVVFQQLIQNKQFLIKP